MSWRGGAHYTPCGIWNAFLIYFSYGQRDEARNRHTCTYVHYEAGRGEQARTHMQQLASNATRRKLSTTALWESTGSSVALPPEEQAKGGRRRETAASL